MDTRLTVKLLTRVLWPDTESGIAPNCALTDPKSGDASHIFGDTVKFFGGSERSCAITRPVGHMKEA